MFGRKQPAFKLDNRRSEEDAVMAHPDPILQPRPEARESIDLPFGEVPVANETRVELERPVRPATQRPDPSALFPPEGEVEPRVATAASPLLKLGSEETVAEGQSAPSKPKRRGGRAKTRLLGIDHGEGKVEDVLAKQPAQVASAPVTYHAVGWLVVIEGPGRGHSMPLRAGVSQLGRGDDQSIQIDFGDTSISRDNHASIAFDEERRAFFIGHGGKANLVRLNEAPVLTTEPLAHGDKIRVGETTLQLVAFCGEDFVWTEGAAPHVSEPEEKSEAPVPETAESPSITQSEGHL